MKFFEKYGNKNKKEDDDLELLLDDEKLSEGDTSKETEDAFDLCQKACDKAYEKCDADCENNVECEDNCMDEYNRCGQDCEDLDIIDVVDEALKRECKKNKIDKISKNYSNLKEKIKEIFWHCDVCAQQKQTDNSRKIVHLLRKALMLEEEAISFYESIAEIAEDKLIKKVLQNIADEERVHVGEFQELLNRFADNEIDLIEKGIDEVEEMYDEEYNESDYEEENEFIDDENYYEEDDYLEDKE